MLVHAGAATQCADPRRLTARAIARAAPRPTVLVSWQPPADTVSEDSPALREGEVARLDGSIDRLVCDLYGLTDDETALVEETTPTPRGTLAAMPALFVTSEDVVAR